MITLGIDIGSSSIKVSLFDASKGESLGSAAYPPVEMEILTTKHDWAEQDPELWMQNLQHAMDLMKRSHSGTLQQVKAIGITYQMHGLVLVDAHGRVIRNSIIWCDSRAVSIGQKAFNDLGAGYCLGNLLNSPGNFTASKLRWLKEFEPDNYQKVHKFMLAGDYVAFRLTNTIATTNSGLSEGIFWDFGKNAISEELLNYYEFQKEIIPNVVETFSIQGKLTSEMARKLGLTAGTPVTYRAGDQPNNALSLKVLKPGEVAATAGTSGVVYGVTDSKKYDPKSRVNTFLHVNNSKQQPRLGILLCLNSVGILNSWAKHQIIGHDPTYDAMNAAAMEIPEGADGVLILPFGNGAERVLENRNPGASIHGLNLAKHQNKHLLRALQESIAFAFNYGIEIMQPLGLDLSIIRAGKTNMFLSPLFAKTLSNLTGATIELYKTDGAEGAARGAAIGAGFFISPEEAFHNFKVLETITPATGSQIHDFYGNWKNLLSHTLESK